MVYAEKIDEAALEMQRKADEERKKLKGRRSYLYASDIFQCMRKIYFEFVDDGKTIKKDDFLPAQIRIFHNGNAVHDRICKYLEEAGVKFVPEVEIPIDPVLNVHGRLDVLVVDEIDTSKYKHILELKSINLPSLARPKREHVAQITYYLHQMKMPEGFLIYESKVNQRVFEFKVDYDPEIAQEILDWFKQCLNYVKTKELPPIIYCKTRYPCKWRTGRCRYYDNCWSKGINRHGSPFIKRFIPEN